MTKAEISGRLSELEDEIADMLVYLKGVKNKFEEVLEDEFFNEDESEEE